MTIDDFIENMKQTASKGLLELSDTGKLSSRTWQFPQGQAEIMVIRGGAIEKAAIMHMVRQGTTRPGITGDIDTFVYQMEVFPENPYCPMGHFNTEGISRGPNRYNMNLDLFPAVRVEEDLEVMRSAMDVVADRFGRDRDKMREGLDEHYTMDHFTAPLAAKVGCKLLDLEGEDLDLFIDAYETFFGVYLDIIAKRKDTTCTESEKRLKLERNGKWLQYLALKDGAIKMSLQRGVTPPEVLKEMGYPPSAIF
jgi:coproporphyrinogen III oxidase